MPSCSERVTSALNDIQLQRLESPVISLSRSKQKALQGRELQCPAILDEPLPLFAVTQPFVFLLHPVHPSTLYSVSQG
mgnify:CR=1 FL=1